MRCNAIWVIAVCFLPVVGYGQNQQLANYQDLITVTTQPPDAASLGKFGNVPVNYNTGATSISIPIFEINVGKTKLPISLDYHSGGIRVDETASSVGIGWALNGIGEVDRNVVDKPDESADGYLASPSFDSLYKDWAYGGGQFGATIDAQYAQFLDILRTGAGETEPDIYSYSLNGSSGKFIIRKDGTFMQFPLSNNVISSAGGGFKIVDPAGTAYIFSLIEHTMVTAGSNTTTYVGRWRLTQIIDPNTVDTITFRYSSACSINVENYHNYTYSLGYGPDCANNPTPNAINYQGENVSTTTIEHFDEQFPTEIDWRGGKITFQDTCDRLDKASEQRINSVNVYAAVKNGYLLTKKVQLYQSYFYSDLTRYSASDERNYRLKLDSVSFLPLDGVSQPETYRMTYNTDVSMASRESMAQDQWGFNNGQFGNPTGMPKQLVTYNAVNYNFGEANRNSDSDAMLSCSIQSIEYPTGGKSVFEFEPHYYLTNTDSTTNPSITCAAYGAVQTTSQTTFTPVPGVSNYNITYDFTAYNYSDVTGRPNITITDQVTGKQIFLSSNIDASQSLTNESNPTTWVPIPGDTYLIVVNIYTTTDVNVSASITIDWTQTYNVNEVAMAGGLRVKSVTNYDVNGAFIGKDIYKYGVGESGMGDVITPSTYLLVNNEQVTYKCGFLADGSDGEEDGCEYVQGSPGVTYYANPVYPASQFSGSSVLYSEVTKYQVDSVGNTNGKSVYEYSIFDDQPGFASTNYSKVGVLLITDLWQNGYLGYELDYKYNSSTRSYTLIHQKVNNYGAARQQSLAGLKFHNNFNWNTSQCYIENLTAENQEDLLVQIPINTGAMLLQSTSDSTYDDAGNVVGSTVSYSYNDTTHLFPTTEVRIDSKNNPRVTNLKYPHDFSTTPVYSGMLGRNIISPVIQTQETYNGVQTRLQNVNYADWLSNGTLFEPSTVDEQVGSYPLETRIKFNSFDKYGNILQQQKVSDMNQAYIWDYNSSYPIAKCINADSASVAYTSFEADGTGNWSLSGGTVDNTQGITGTNSYENGTISKSGLNPATTYIVSYWSQNGAYSIPGTISGFPQQGKTISYHTPAWTLYVHKVTGQSTITVNATGHIDELRLYPATAQMTTYTYDPLVGMTSQMDAGNRATYYEYDGLQRLKRVRDQDYNILKTIDYAYQAPAGCGSGCYSVAMQTFAGTNTISYPVGVFDVNGKLLGNAANASTYVSRWNSDTADARVGTLSQGSDSMHFNLALNAGQTLPASVIGLRYFQVDLAWNVFDAVRQWNGAYIDFGDGTGIRMPSLESDTPAIHPPYTDYIPYHEDSYYHELAYYFPHYYPDTTLKTITCYHNDTTENSDFDNWYGPATGLTRLRNLRGYLPQHTDEIGGSCYQQASMTSLQGILNWNTITSVKHFRLWNGDGTNPCLNISYPQDFMAGNKGLFDISAWYNGSAAIGAGDTSFRLSRMKSDWNTYFLQLQDIWISERNWNHEDLSHLTQLNAFGLIASDADGGYEPGGPYTPLDSTEVDNIINQISSGAGQSVHNGFIDILTGGSGRTSASQLSVNQLINKGWSIYIDGVLQTKQ